MANDAWDLLRAALAGFAPSDFDPGAAAAIDAELGAWVAAHPGRLEAELPDRLAALAAAPGAIEDHLPTQLAVLLALAAPDTVVHDWERRLDTTLRALDPIAMLGVVGQARRDHVAALGGFVPIALTAYFAARAGEDAVAGAPIAPELRDHLRALLWKRPLPDVLPRVLHTLSPRAIEARFAAYLDLGVDALTRRLRGPDARFLAPGEGLGDVIARDAATLHALGVDRHALADRLAALLDDAAAAAPPRRARLSDRRSVAVRAQLDPLRRSADRDDPTNQGT